MKLAVIGVNHKTAPVELREKLSFGADLPVAIGELGALSDGCTIVSTCNRSELYIGIADDKNSAGNDEAHALLALANTDAHTDGDEFVYAEQIAKVCQWLADFKGVNFAEIAPYLYIYERARALNHWLRVAAGLDSMILGEPQILGQIRQAVALSREHGGISSDFGWLTQQVFAAARIVRRDTSVGQQAVTLGFATAKLVTQIFDEPSEQTFLLVAAGEMNRLVAHNVAALGMKHIIIANRSRERAENLARELHEMAAQANRPLTVDLVGLSALDDVLHQADVVSSCSGSMQALISYDMTKAALKRRRNKPMLMVDLAVPRDIEPSAGTLDDVYLYSVDDLQHVIAGNLQERKQAAVEAEILISQLVLDIEHQAQVQTARSQIAAYRSTAQWHKTRLLEEAMLALDDGADSKTVLAEFAHKLTQTLAHAPSKMIRHVALHGEPAALEMAAHALNHAYRAKSSPKPSE
ncbi:glutamyl-tRNA reductase [Moraxella caviae]|nr:glutamyl-tRNA reductase [Moraxella caviae]OOR90859.1 glutamyl-tRNA reductase [Moraxella caviae]